MTNMNFEWQIDEYMIYCRSRQLREKTMNSYEQSLHLFARWCKEELKIEEVDKITEGVSLALLRRSAKSCNCDFMVLSNAIYYK